MKPREPPKRRRAAEGGSELVRALKWLNSYRRCSAWMQRFDIDALLDAGGGLAVVPDFLPPFVAEGALRILEAMPPARWNDTAAAEDYTHNNIAHAFWSVKPADNDGALEALLRAFSLLAPDQLHAFSAARYERGHHIAPHDDRAYTPVRLDTGEVVSCSRDLTVVYYLTKDWTEAMGGCLVDLEAEDPGQRGGSEGDQGRAREAAGGGAEQHPAQQKRGRVVVPQFNTAVFFRVPRYHSVTPLRTDRPRYSVFGWFLQSGQLYDLFRGQEEDIERQIAYRQRQRRRQGTGGAAAAATAAVRREAGGGGAGEAEENGGGGGQEAEEGGSHDEALAPHQCKLAQRLLAHAGSKRRRRQAGAG